MATIAEPPRDYGNVETRFFTTGSEADPIRLQSGQTLPGITLAYETYGELSPEKDNAILVFHALSGSQHAAGHNPSVPGVEDLWTEECTTGWWDDFIGPGKAFDTTRFFVICVNYLGGCYGTTGPASINPATGKPYGGAFPRVTIADIVDSQFRLLDHLGIHQLHAVTGGSLGGMMCLSLASRYPERVRIVMPIATGVQTTSLQRITNFEQVCALEHDPLFQGGDYYAGPRPESGMVLARMIAHKTFVSLSTLERRARRDIHQPDGHFSYYTIRDTIESYMLYQGLKFVSRFDANTYLRILDLWQTFDLAGDAGVDSLEKVFLPCRDQRYMVFSIDSDVCYYPDQQEELINLLKAAKVPQRRITIHSEKGHDAFLLEPSLLTPHLQHALERDW